MGRAGTVHIVGTGRNVALRVILKSSHRGAAGALGHDQITRRGLNRCGREGQAKDGDQRVENHVLFHVFPPVGSNDMLMLMA